MALLFSAFQNRTHFGYTCIVMAAKRKLKLAVAARGMGKITGVEKYVNGFLGGLSPYHDRFEIHIYYNQRDHIGSFPHLHEHCIPTRLRFLWDHVLLPLALLREGFDLVLYTKNTCSLLAPGRSLLIVYDLGYFYPELHAYRPLDTLYMKAMLRYSARCAWGIFTISESTRQDVIRLLGAAPEKVVSILGDTTDEFAPVIDTAALQRVKQKYNLQQPFIFYPADISPRKNIDRLLQSFTDVIEQIPHHLYLTGMRAWNTSELQKRLRGSGLRRVHRLGRVEAADMPALYSLADFSVYISLFEGLGLPVLEAFSCGSPLMASTQTSIPELTGDAAYMVDGYAKDEIAAGLFALAQDEPLKARLRAAGFERAKLFSWQKTVAAAVHWIEQNWAQNP